MAGNLELFRKFFEMTSCMNFTTRCWDHPGIPSLCLLWVSLSFTAVASTPGSRQTFIASVIKFLHQYEFDGLDFDQEYPGSHGSTPQDKHLFSVLVQVRCVPYHFDWKAHDESHVKDYGGCTENLAPYNLRKRGRTWRPQSRENAEEWKIEEVNLI